MAFKHEQIILTHTQPKCEQIFNYGTRLNATMKQNFNTNATLKDKLS